MNQAASHVSTPAGDLSFLKGGSGPAVVVIHGIGGHKEDWTALVAALAPSHTVYAIDMVGFGTSAKTAPEITIATQMASVIALLNAENIETADLVGNSVGGWVAAMIAASQVPEVTVPRPVSEELTTFEASVLPVSVPAGAITALLDVLVTRPFAFTVTLGIAVELPTVPGAELTVASVATWLPVPGPAVTSPVSWLSPALPLPKGSAT